VIGGVVGVLVLVGAALVVEARAADGDRVPEAAWRALPVPRSARVDTFERSGALGPLDGFGRWQVTGSLAAGDGLLRSASGEGIATVDARSDDVLVHAQVVHMGGGGGLLVSSASIGVPALLLRATGPDAWELSWQRSGVAPEVLETFGAPTASVSVQLIRRGDHLKVAFDDEQYDVEVPVEMTGGTSVGIVTGPGTELDLFGYLPLDA
jgi:hypothetical protein